MRSRWWAVAVGVAVLVAWGVSAVTTTAGSRHELRSAQAQLLLARDAITAADLDAASRRLAEASSHIDDARRGLERGDLRALGSVPALGNNLRVARVIARATEQVTEAARTLVAGLTAAAETDLADDDLPVDALADLGPQMQSLATVSRQAVDDVANSPDSWLLGEVRDARTEFLELLDPLSAQAEQGAELLDALSIFLGADNNRRYFLAAANPAEARGATGYLGAFSIVTVDGGNFDIGPFESLSNLPNLGHDEIDPPTDWFDARYRKYGGAGFWQNLNMTPDFPTAAAAIERLWERTTGEPLDGTIVVDPFAFQALLEVTGPVDIPDGPRLDADSVVDYVTNQAYAELEDPDERKAVLGAVAAATLTEFLERFDRARLQSSMDLLGNLVSDEHLLVHSTDEAVQEVFERLGVAGALDAPRGDYLSVTTNSGTGSKVDYYTQRRLSYEVTLGANGRASGELAVTILNDAPTDGMPRYVIGPNTPGLEAGDNLLWVSVYAPTHATMTHGPETSKGRTILQTEKGHPVASTWIDVPAGTTARLEYGWTGNEVWFDEDGHLVYELTYEDHVTIRPTAVTVDVRIPDGFEVVDAPSGASTAGGTSTLSLSGEDAQLIWRLSPARDS